MSLKPQRKTNQLTRQATRCDPQTPLENQKTVHAHNSPNASSLLPLPFQGVDDPSLKMPPVLAK